MFVSVVAVFMCVYWARGGGGGVGGGVFCFFLWGVRNIVLGRAGKDRERHTLKCRDREREEREREAHVEM